MSRSAQGSFIVLVLGLFIWRCACQSECSTTPGITVTPSANQTVPINTDTSVTYRCQVTNGRRADWSFMGIQVPIGSGDHTLLGSHGVNISAGSSVSDIYFTVDRTGRQNYMNRDLKIVCTALTFTPVFMFDKSCEYFIRTFDVPQSLPNLDFNPSPTNPSMLVISWDQPNNTLTDEDDPVTTTYTITVTGPTFNFNKTTTATRYSFVDDIEKHCAMHNFQVYASNAAGDGPPDVINKIISICCPPYCTVKYCSAESTRTALCTLRESGCDAKCRVTYCQNCYYDDEYRPLPISCKTCPPVEINPVEIKFSHNARCLRRWSLCTRRADSLVYPEVRAQMRTSENFKCYEHPCA